MGSHSTADALLVAARAGDQAALRALLGCLQRDLGRPLGFLVRTWRGSEKDPDDLLDEVALAVLQGLGRLRAANYAAFRAWCVETARNRLRSEHRERRRRERRLAGLAVREEAPPVEAGPARPVAGLARGLGGLPPSQR